MTCPLCSSSSIRVSRNRHWNDILYCAIGHQAYRCQKCGGRFYAPKSSEPIYERPGRSDRVSRSKRRLSARRLRRLAGRFVVVIIFAVMFLIFWLYLRYITTERIPSHSSGVTNNFSTKPIPHSS